jgi:hypothetical protein
VSNTFEVSNLGVKILKLFVDISYFESRYWEQIWHQFFTVKEISVGRKFTNYDPNWNYRHVWDFGDTVQEKKNLWYMHIQALAILHSKR